MKSSKILLNDDVQNEIHKWIKDKIHLNNVAAIYYSSQLFSLSKPSLCFIERCFSMFVDSHTFLELDFMSVAKILASSELNIDSELQVFNAAEAWLKHHKERSKHARYIFSKIRFSLLSTPAKNYISNNFMFLNTDFVVNSKETLSIKEVFHIKKHSTTSRYCNDNNFNIFMCGGYDKDTLYDVSDVYSIQANNQYSANVLPQLEESREFSYAVCIKGEVYVFGGCKTGADHLVMSIEKYSPSTGTWSIIGHMYDERGDFCACSFTDSIYVIGGYLDGPTNSCIQFDTKYRNWKEICRLNETRNEAACAVFEGRVVVSGGEREEKLRTVEAYDHVADSWLYMPNMNKGRSHHKSVAIKNKLFVVGSDTPMCEVFDSNCNKFVLLKSPETWDKFFDLPNYATSIGSKLVIFGCEKLIIFFYDVINQKWSEKPLEEINDIDGFPCAKVPWY